MVAEHLYATWRIGDDLRLLAVHLFELCNELIVDILVQHVE